MTGRKRSLREALLELFFPARCCFCRRLTRNGAPLCPTCAAKYPNRRGSASERLLSGTLRCLSPLRYAGEARQAVLRYKFGGLTVYAPVFGGFLRKCLDESGISCDSITWVPLSAKRLRARGYDQARLLAEELARGAQLPCERLLEKTRNTPAQSGLRDAAARRRNAAGAYRAPEPERVAGKRVLLVDDIVTSGATLCECARILRQAGAKSVTAMTLASRD